jgi:hypothetical protein
LPVRHFLRMLARCLLLSYCSCLVRFSTRASWYFFRT